MMMVLALLFILMVVGFVIFGAIVLLGKAIKRKEDPALTVFRDRFARGEISEEEFQHRRRYLR